MKIIKYIFLSIVFILSTSCVNKKLVQIADSTSKDCLDRVVDSINRDGVLKVVKNSKTISTIETPHGRLWIKYEFGADFYNQNKEMHMKIIDGIKLIKEGYKFKKVVVSVYVYSNEPKDNLDPISKATKNL